MPFANEHAARQQEPDQYKTMRRGHVKGFPAGITVIWGITRDGKSEIQSVRADSSKWTADDFAAWLKEHDMKAAVEKATGDKVEKQSEQHPEIEAYTDDAGRLRLLLLAELEPDGTPPKSIKILRPGVNPTTKGPVVFDDEAAADTMATFSEHGLDSLPFDYEHGMLADHRTAETGKAAAWFSPGVFDGHLCASDIQWTPAADAALRAREYRFFSPAVELDAKTRRVKRLINVALTNRPAMKGIRPLVASEDSDAGAPSAGDHKEHNMSQLLKLLGAEDETAAVVALTERDNAHKALLAEHESLKTKLTTAETESTKLAERLNELEGAARKAAHEALIVQLSEAGKLEPALHDWARTISTDSLKAFGEKKAASKPEPKPKAEGEVTLSEEDEALCKAHNIDRAKFIETKRALAGRKVQ